jgi:outer membrane immunogenic protein
MKKLVLVGIIALVAGPTMAADLAVKAPVMPPPPTYNWSGFYLGINGGGGIALGTVEDKDCFFCASDSFHQGFGEFGGQIGYNWQFGSTVLGVEAEWNWNSLNHSGFLGLDDTIALATNLKLNSFGAVRARAGLAFDRTLVYVTAGPAWGHLQGTGTSICQQTAPCTFDQMPNFRIDSWNWGLLGGAGVEFMLAPNWTLRGEYVVLALTDSTASATNLVPTQFGCIGNATSTRQCRVGFMVSEQIGRIGLNYKFGGMGY